MQRPRHCSQSFLLRRLRCRLSASEVILASLQSGTGADVIVSVLEHGLTILDALLTSTPRKLRNEIVAFCDALETRLGRVDDAAAAQLSSCAASELAQFSQSLCAVELLPREARFAMGFWEIPAREARREILFGIL